MSDFQHIHVCAVGGIVILDVQLTLLALAPAVSATGPCPYARDVGIAGGLRDHAAAGKLQVRWGMCVCV